MISIEQITYLNEIGQRQQLEDSIYPLPGRATFSDRLFMVCDGVGGENMGEEASRIACEGFAHFFEQNQPPRVPLAGEYINEGQRYVLQQMHRYAKTHPEAQKMSTTLTLAYINGNNISVAWCGDSRVYHLRKGEVIWRSSDHSLVENLVKHGEITEQEARQHPQRNIITRALSANGVPSEIDNYVIRNIQDGDYILLCTDGILEQINDERLKNILKSHNKDKKSLFMEYCKDITSDNFSLYLLKLANDTPSVLADNRKRLLVPFLLSLIILSVLGILLKDNIKGLFKPSKDNQGVVVQKKSPSKPEPANPPRNETKQLPAKENGATSQPDQVAMDSVAQKIDTGKGLNVALSGKRIKIKATITKVKNTPAAEKKKNPVDDSTKIEVAPPQNLD